MTAFLSGYSAHLHLKHLHIQFFDMLDINNDGFLTKSELSDLFDACFTV